MEHANESLRWILLFPLIATAFSGLWMLFMPRQLPRAAVIGISCGAPILSFLVGFREFFNLTNEANPRLINNGFVAGSPGPDFGTTRVPLPGREMQVGVRFRF